MLHVRCRNIQCLPPLTVLYARRIVGLLLLLKSSTRSESRRTQQSSPPVAQLLPSKGKASHKGNLEPTKLGAISIQTSLQLHQSGALFATTQPRLVHQLSIEPSRASDGVLSSTPASTVTFSFILNPQTRPPVLPVNPINGRGCPDVADCPSCMSPIFRLLVDLEAHFPWLLHYTLLLTSLVEPYCWYRPIQ